MSYKNPTKGQKSKAFDYEHNYGMSKENALSKAIQQKGPDRPQRIHTSIPDRIDIPSVNPYEDWAATESDL